MHLLRTERAAPDMAARTAAMDAALDATAARLEAAGVVFVPFLACDNGGGGGSGDDGAGGSEFVVRDARDAVAVNAEALGATLRLPFGDFVALMAGSRAAGAFMESFLGARRRPYVVAAAWVPLTL